MKMEYFPRKMRKVIRIGGERCTFLALGLVQAVEHRWWWQRGEGAVVAGTKGSKERRMKV